MKFNQFVLSGGLLLSLLLFVASTKAGGCCFQSFETSPGIAGSVPAQIRVSFIDPRNLGGKTQPLRNVPINISIDNRVQGQSCSVFSTETNTDGMIEAECSSATEGEMNIRFTSPSLSDQENKTMSTVSKSVSFNPNPKHIKDEDMGEYLRKEATSSDKFSQNSEDKQASSDAQILELQQKVDTLTEKVEEQNQQIGQLQQLIQNFISFVKSLFGG